ncbi:MAG: hypothetical protein IKT82_01030 [Bacteroidaceae bacterium]|nr:hypothetical protein [Bacteroidaceae bacterium]
MERIIYTYRRGVCVARFDKMGDARASMRETSNSTGSHAFFVSLSKSIIAEFGGPIGENHIMSIIKVDYSFFGDGGCELTLVGCIQALIKLLETNDCIQFEDGQRCSNEEELCAILVEKGILNAL